MEGRKGAYLIITLWTRTVEWICRSHFDFSTIGGE
jgi:hypothetical protein